MKVVFLRDNNVTKFREEEYRDKSRTYAEIVATNIRSIQRVAEWQGKVRYFVHGLNREPMYRLDESRP